MATDNKTKRDNDPEVRMPDVGEPAPVKSAGKWIIWFIVLLAIALLIVFLV